MPGQLRLLFVRHGETQDNIDRILQGQRDTDLTVKGHKEAEVIAGKLKDEHINAIYHSPLKRMVQTIAPILESHPDTPKESDKDLMGQSLGKFEGNSYDSIDMSNPRSAEAMEGDNGVEPFNDFVTRLKRVLGRIIGAQAPEVGDNDRVIVIATHGVGITSIFKALENTPHCDGLNPKIAKRGPDAYEVRWTDSDDVAELVVAEPSSLPIKNHVLDWENIEGEPFLIETWGKKEKAL